MLGKVFKAYDVRATYPSPLNEQTAWKIGFGTARYLIGEAENAGDTDPMMRHIVVGRDMRPSSPALAEALIEGIRTFGANVIDVGMVDTPFIYFAINYLACAGGVMVTASHNPVNYNGFKISGRNALPIGSMSGLGEISKFAAMADTEKTPTPAVPMGRVEPRDFWDGYVEHVLSFLDPGDRKFKVVVDASNGMAGTMFKKVFGEVEALEVIELNFRNTHGKFAHEPNPLIEENLKQLRDTVLAEKAYLGVCFDGDADRVVFVDEKAQIVGCDHLTALLAAYYLKREPGARIVYDLRSSKALEENIMNAGGVPIQSRVGHVFMKQALRENDAIFGGELSGHFYFRDNFNADSGAIAFAQVLSALSTSKKKFSQLISPIARYLQSGELNFTAERPSEALEALEDEFGPYGRVSHLDGVSIDAFADGGWWCNVRCSNTEPVVRLNLEARNKTIRDKMLGQIAPVLGEPVEH